MKSWLGKLGICSLLGLFLWASAGFAAEGLIHNSGFEEGASSWETDVWNSGDTYSKFSVTESPVRSGSKAAYIESARENDAKWVQKVEVKPNTLYKLSGWIRAEGATSGAKGANLSVLGSMDMSADLLDTSGEFLYVELYGRTGDKQKEIKVAARLGGYGSLNKGKAWFDDIALEEMDAAPAGVTVASFTEAKTNAGADGKPAAATTGTPFKLMGYALAFFLLYGIAYITLFRKDRMERFSPSRAQLWLFALLAAGLVLRLILAKSPGYVSDMNTFKAWASHAASGGLTQFYNTDMFVDYPPGYIYVLYVLGKLQSFYNLAMDSVPLLVLMKLPAMLADLVTAGLFYRMAVKKLGQGAAFGIALLYVFNPAILINSADWGQVDSFFTLFLLLTFNAVRDKKPIAAGILFALTVLVKPQALIYTPVLLFFYWQGKSWKSFLQSAASGLAVLLAGILPFSLSMKPLWIIHLYKETLMSYPYASLNAFNLYALTLGNWKPLSDTFILFSYGTWGTLFIFVAVGLALYYFLKGKHHTEGLPYFIGLVLISTMFLFGSKMHERYWFPAVALALAVFVYVKDRRLLQSFVGLSVCHYLNVAYVLNLSWDGATPAKTDGVMLLTSFASLVLFGYLLKIGYDVFVKGQLQPVYDSRFERSLRDTVAEDSLQGSKPSGILPESLRLGMTRRDWQLMLGLTAVYAAVAFYNLGSLKAPETVGSRR